MEVVDTIVVGAGVAGLACARRLAEQGMSVVVLEARDRVGGRIWTLRQPGYKPVELGAQVVHGSSAATWAIIQAAGIEIIPLQQEYDLVLGIDGATYRASHMRQMRMPAPWKVELQLLRDVGPDRPANQAIEALGIAGLGQTVVLEWLAQVWAADPKKLSTAGMREIKSAWQAGQGEFVLPEGYDQVPRYLARGVDIRLNTPVRLVRWSPHHTETEANGNRWRSRAVVITVPPPLVAAGDLHFDPPLPLEKELAAKTIPWGDAIGVIARLKKPISESVSGLVVSPIGGFWRADRTTQLIAGWIKGPAAERARGQLSDAASVVRCSQNLFPWLQANMISEIHLADWGADPYALGAFSYPGIGALQQPHVWARPVSETLFFAGEATCGPLHPAMVHGALESGVRAAAEVLHELGD